MKKLFIIAILSIMPLFQNCGAKEKQEVTATPKDSIATNVSETVIIDSVATVKGTEIIVEDLSNKVEKTTVAEKLATVTKVTVKKPAKVVTETKTETKVAETTKVEVVVTQQPPKKAVETQPIVKVVVKDLKVATITSGWKVPAKYKTMKNPTNKTDKENMAIGKSLYSKYCKSCHGAEGYGDGSKAADQKGDLGDFSSEETQSQSDGALFYKISTGRDDMPDFTKKLPDDEDRWLIVNYLRTLAE